MVRFRPWAISFKVIVVRLRFVGEAAALCYPAWELSRPDSDSEKIQMCAATKSSRSKSASATEKSASKKTIQLTSSDFQTKIKSLASERQSALKGQPLALAASNFGMKSPWLVHCSDHLRARNLAGWISEQLSGSPPPKIKTYFAGELSTAAAVNAISQSLNNLSLFGESEIILIFDIDALRVAQSEPLLKACSSISGDSLLLMTAAKPDDRGTVGRFAQLGINVILEELSGTSLLKWVVKECERAGVGIEAEAANLLAERYGENLTALNNEIARLSLFVARGKQITGALVKEQVRGEHHHDSFELIRAVAKKDALAAHALGQALMSQGFHPIQLTTLMQKCYRVMLARKGIEQGPPLHRELSNPFFWKNCSSAAAAHSSADLKAALVTLQNTELRLKSSGMGENTVFLSAVNKLASRQYENSIRNR
jgi:DNA polymerase III subunit delta